MQTERPSVEPDQTVSSPAREVEYALILSRMINIVKGDPSQMRLAIYEFARARLKIDTSWAEEAERQQLSAALETAIQGVEQFSTRQQEQERIQYSPPPAQIGLATSLTEAASNPISPVHRMSPAPDGVAARRPWRADPLPPVLEVRMHPRLSRMTRFSIGIFLLGLTAAVGLAIYAKPTSIVQAGAHAMSRIGLSSPGSQTSSSTSTPEQTALAPELRPAAVASTSPSLPLPSDYGVYALSNAELSELQVLPGQVPDKRIAMSTPINQPSRTTLPDGKARFVLFRRDLLGNALDRVEVRVVARVVRALTFDAKGKPNFVPVSDAWNIRNLSYELKVRPIPGNPEMLLAQLKDADFALPSGRYVLALKNEGYDFTVAGEVSDPSQCLERTDAANGSFYTQCQKQ